MILKYIRTIFAFAVMASAGVAFCSDASDLLIGFETKGPDAYADGKSALDGEWYALVWSADGQFEGLNLDCTPTDSADEVVITAPLAKGGRCPSVVFEVDSSKAHNTGTYAVYLLDTRNTAGNQAASAVSLKGQRMPECVNGAHEVMSYVSIGTALSGDTDGLATDGAWEASSVDLPEGLGVARITKVEVAGNEVVLATENLQPGVKYNVKMGPKPENLSSYAFDIPKTSQDSPTFHLSPENARFFKLIREPLSR